MADFFEDLKRDLEAATPGPWHTELCHTGESCWCRVIVSDQPHDDERGGCVSTSGNITKEDSALIARVPQLAQLVLLLPEIREAMINHPPEVDNAKARHWDQVLAKLDATIAEVSQ